MKIFYLKCYNWLLSQNQRVRNDFFGYRRYEALVKNIKKNIKVDGCQCADFLNSFSKILYKMKS